jgi:hypothetical protein
MLSQASHCIPESNNIGVSNDRYTKSHENDTKCNPHYTPIVAQPMNGSSCVATHLHRWCRTTLVLVWHIRWRHHHRVRHCVLHCRHCEHFASVLIKGDHTLRTLVIAIWKCVCWNWRRGHRWARAGAIGRRILSRLGRGQVSLRCYNTRWTVSYQ